MRLRDRTTVITGAASGIGRAVAVSLAKRGCHLALADLNEGGLQETRSLLAPHQLRVSLHRLDVADRVQVAAMPEAVMAGHLGVDLLVNNAGVALGGKFEEISEADFEWLFEINFWGVVRMTRAFLPLLKAREEARIVNLSSVYALIAPPGQTAYAASKFAVRGFSTALRHELAGTNVGVTVIHPGGVATAIANTARISAHVPPEEAARGRERANRLLRMPPAAAGEIIIRGIEASKARVLVRFDAKAATLIECLAPVSYWKLLNRLAQRS